MGKTMAATKAQATESPSPTITINPRVNYLDKQEFLKRIIEYRKAVKLAKKHKRAKPRIPDHIGLSLEAIAKNMAKHPSYNGYTFKDQMISDAVEGMIRYFDNFDPKHAKQNPFGYFTTCCARIFWRRIEIEKEELYAKYKIAQQSGIMDEFGLGSNGEHGEGESDLTQQDLYPNLHEYIAKYEEGIRKRRAKKVAAETKKRKPKGLEKFGG